MKMHLAALALLPLALSACGSAAMTDLQEGLGMKKPEAEAPATPPRPAGPPAVSPLEQAIEIEGGQGKPAVNADAETMNTPSFTARGNEPFWLVDISEGKAIYKTPENQAGRSVAVRRLTFASGVEFVGELNGSAFAVTIRGMDCIDSMSGEKFPMTATLKTGSRVNSGCAAPAGEMTPARPAAPADPAAAAARSDASAAAADASAAAG